MEAGIIHHVSHSEPFSDDNLFYRFQEDDESNILNMKRVWDSSIPTRDAIDVAKDMLTRLALLCEEFRKKYLAADRNSPLLPPDPAPVIPTSPLLPGMTTPRLSDPIIPVSASAHASPIPRALSSPTLPAPNLSPMLTLTPQLASTPSTPCILMVDSGSDEVDYSTLEKSEPFRHYCLLAAELQRVQIVTLNHDERIAFFVNIYNTLCLHAYVVHGPPDSVLKRYTFFRALSYRVGGLDLTLDDVEHGILRGNKRPPMLPFLQQLRSPNPKCQHVITDRDGRIHFVISAGTRSDPPIRILDGENVQEDLHHATLEFLHYNVKIDPEKRCVTIPRIFSWYAEDFPTPEKSLLLWVARYLPVAASNEMVRLVNGEGTMPTIFYENFDWAKSEARFNAPAVRRKRRRLEMERSSLLLTNARPGLMEMKLVIPAPPGLAPIISPDLIAPSVTIAPTNRSPEPHSSSTGLLTMMDGGFPNTGAFPSPLMQDSVGPSNRPSIMAAVSGSEQSPAITQSEVADLAAASNMAHKV